MQDQPNSSTAASELDDHILTLNPIVGISIEDLTRSAMELLQAAAVQPQVAAQHLMKLNAELTRVMLGVSEHAPAPKDARFAAAEFSESPLYSRLARGWVAWQAVLKDWVEAIGLEGVELERARFVTSLLADAMAPTNTLLGNPAALRKARETRGRSLLAGLRNFVDDMVNNHGMPSQVDKSQFKVGGNLANTPGAVIHRGDLAELIQYQPRTDTQNAQPILIVPPQINKFYLYDISPAKSMVAYLLEQGFQVFIISWRNPTAEHRSWGLDDYVDAIETAIDVTREVSGADSVNCVGACAGGITLATALGYLAGKNELHKVASLTLMVNVLQPSTDDSAIGLFASSSAVEAARKRSARAGVLDGNDTARIFNWMRPNDLIWNYVVSNYLQGNTPPAFDILFWNNDVTRLPARLHSDFLDVFDDNALARDGGLKIHDVPIELSRVTVPAYITGGTTDHITPWHACYRTTQILGGASTFVLSTAGHIQSLINPPAGSKRQYLLNPETPESAAGWRAAATEHPGSWWPHWSHWLQELCSEQREAPTAFGNARHPELCPSPGTYVFE